MGYWNSLGDVNPNGLVWGDSPADIMDEAVDNIVAQFEADQNRKPRKSELREGLEFYLRIRDDLAD